MGARFFSNKGNESFKGKMTAETGGDVVCIEDRFDRDGARAAKSVMERGFPPPVHELEQDGREGFADRSLAACRAVTPAMEGHARKVKENACLVALDVHADGCFLPRFGKGAHFPGGAEGFINSLVDDALHGMFGGKFARMGTNLVDNDANVLAKPVLPADSLCALEESLKIGSGKAGQAGIHAIGGAEAQVCPIRGYKKTRVSERLFFD